MEHTAGTCTLVELLKGSRITDERKEADWNHVCLLARRHQIIPYLVSLLKEDLSKVPAQWSKELKEHYLYSLQNNLGLWKEFLHVRRRLQEASIPIVPMKGVDILARFYPCFETREMADIDILIREKDFEQAALILEQSGYRKNLEGLKERYWRKKHCHIGFLKGETSIEIHWSLDLKRKNALLPDIWKRVQEHPLPADTISLLSAEDSFFAFALHLRRFGDILSLKQTLDAAQIIRSTKDFSWSYVLKEARRGRMRATLYFLLIQIHLFTRTQIPAEAIDGLRLPAWQRRKIKNLILSATCQEKPALRQIYLKAHFLLYDDLCEPLWYIITIPHEQFCKFYGLKAYSKRAAVRYWLRFFYMPLQRAVLRRQTPPGGADAI